MDEKEVKQEEDIATDSSEEIEFYWDLFNIDLCDIIRKDLKSLFTPQSNQQDANNTDSIYLDTKQQEIAAKKKQINENGQILISNIYGKMFILYPQHNTLITFDSLRLTNYLNDTQSDKNNNHIPERGISPPNKLYRVFTNITANTMKLSLNQQYIALCSHTSFKIYHIAQFFNEINPNPMSQIIAQNGENIFKFDWNDNSLFLVIHSNNKRILKHFNVNNGYKLIGLVPNIPHHMIMEIKLLSNDTFALCLQNGFVIFYKYCINNEYQVIHSINMNKQHTHVHSKSSTLTPQTIPYLITHMQECNCICIHYGTPSPQTEDKYLPYFAIFKYDSFDLKSLQCVLCDHTGLNDINNDFQGIKSMYIGGELDLLIFCGQYDYQLSVYDANRNILDVKGLMVKYDEDRDNGNICDIGVDFINNIACMDLESEQNTLPPVPIIYLLTNKMNIGCFNIIPYDNNYNDKQLLRIMSTPIHSLPPIPIPLPIANNNDNINQNQAKMSIEILEKYKKLYCGYFKELYLKHAPQKVGKIGNLMKKYSSSYAQLQGLYEKLVSKYELDPSEIKPLVSIAEIEKIQFDENGDVIVIQNEPKTPVKISPQQENNDDDNNSIDFDGLSDLNTILTFVNDDNDAVDVKDDDKEYKQSANIVNIVSKEVIKKKKEKAPFSSAIFDDQVPNEEVEYEFFNAFKQIQVEIERVKIEKNAFSSSMNKMKLELEPSIHKYQAKLDGLSSALKNEKQSVNQQESELFENSLKSKHQRMYAKAMQLSTKCEKLKDVTYIKALKRRGLNPQQENTLCGISNKIKEAQLQIDELRAYKHDETDLFVNHNKQSPNYIYQRCTQVENVIRDRYEKYLNLIESHAPHLLVQQLSITTPKSHKKPVSSFLSFVSSIRESLPSSPGDDPLYRKYANLRNKKSRFNTPNTNTTTTTPRQFTSNRLSKYEKRLNSAKTYNYKQFITPITQKTQSQTTTTSKSSTATQSPLKLSPNKWKTSPIKERKHELDLRNFQTKIQRTPCKSSCKKPAELKRLVSYKQLSRQQSIVSQTPEIHAQKASKLEFKRTPGFKTVKREDRKHFVRNEILNHVVYKPPQKPMNFVPFSAKKEVVSVSVPVQEEKSDTQVLVPSTPTPPLTPKTCNFTSTAKTVSTSTPLVVNDIIGLTTTPPPLQAVVVEDEKEEKKNESLWNWGGGGNDDKKEEIQNDNGGDGGDGGGVVMDLVSIYKQRIREIYMSTNQGESDKLKKLNGVLVNIDKHSGDAGWIHNLYLKICKKYARNPQPMVGGNNSNNNNNNNNSNNNSGWAMTSFGGGDSGFGSMSNWNTSSQNINQSQTNQQQTIQQQSTNVFSNFGGGGSTSGANNNSWNWSTNQANNNNNGNNTMGFASSSSSTNQPSWVNNNLSSMASGGGGGGNNNNNASDPFAAFANSSSGFGSLLNS